MHTIRLFKQTDTLDYFMADCLALSHTDPIQERKNQSKIGERIIVHICRQFLYEHRQPMFKHWHFQISMAIAMPMFECRCLNDLLKHWHVQTLAPMFECRSVAVGRRGKSFSGCRCAKELVRLNAPLKLSP